MKFGYTLWIMSGKQWMPTQDDVDRYDWRWVTDLYLADTIKDYTQNDHPMMQVARRLVSQRKAE